MVCGPYVLIVCLPLPGFDLHKNRYFCQLSVLSLWHLESAWQVVGMQSVDATWICLVLLAFAVDVPSSRIISQDQ